MPPADIHELDFAGVTLLRAILAALGKAAAWSGVDGARHLAAYELAVRIGAYDGLE